MSLARANEILDIVRVGGPMPVFLINQALVVTGDLASAPQPVHEAESAEA